MLSVLVWRVYAHGCGSMIVRFVNCLTLGLGGHNSVLQEVHPVALQDFPPPDELN